MCTLIYTKYGISSVFSIPLVYKNTCKHTDISMLSLVMLELKTQILNSFKAVMNPPTLSFFLLAVLWSWGMNSGSQEY